MAKTVSDLFVEGIIEWGVKVVFGLPGDGINGVMEALRKNQEKIRFVQVRHEEAAAFMACAYAKYTGKLGCCLATSGPGAIHLLNGLYDAKMDGAPVLAITGQAASDLRGSRFQQEVNLVRLFEDVAVYNQELIDPNQIQMLTNEACRHALNHRSVAHISFPNDYQDAEPDGKISLHNQKAEMTASAWTKPLTVPPEAELRRAAEILNAAKKPIILAGAGALDAGDELIEIAAKLGAPVIKALLGKAVIPDEHPLSMGGLGLLGTTPAQNAAENCDAIFLVGTTFPYLEFLPKPEDAKGVQIDDKPDRIGLRYPIEVGLVGDAKQTLAALNQFVETKEDRSFLKNAQDEMQDWWKLMETRAMRDDVPIKPQRAAWELSDLAAQDAIFSGDSGTNTIWAARQFKVKQNQKWSCSGTLATMGCGLPYAIAAKIAFPERQSIAFVGDGGFTMLMGEFVTAVKYDLPITVVIIKNNSLGQIKWEQIVFLGNPEYGCELQEINFARYAEACGGIGITVERPEDIRPALERALAADKPTLVEILVDANEPPMPSKIEAWQAKNFAEALAKGQSDRGKIATTIFRNKINELFS